MSYNVKDSGQRQSFDSGMVRDVADDKIDYSLVLDGPMFERWAAHLTAGAKKYNKRNWMLARGQAEYDRFRESALRHFIQWFRGEIEEDHAAAIFFNVCGAEYVREKLPCLPYILQDRSPAARMENAQTGGRASDETWRLQESMRSLQCEPKNTCQDSLQSPQAATTTST